MDAEDRKPAPVQPRRFSTAPSQPYARLKSLWCRREKPNKSNKRISRVAPGEESRWRGGPSPLELEEAAAAARAAWRMSRRSKRESRHDAPRQCAKCGGPYGGFGEVCPQCRASARPGKDLAVARARCSPFGSSRSSEAEEDCGGSSSSSSSPSSRGRGSVPCFTLTVLTAGSDRCRGQPEGSEPAEAEAGTEELGSGRLLEAACAGDAAAVAALCAAGCRANDCNFEGVSPLLCASIVGCEALVRVLLGSRADPNLADAFGSTPLQAAAFDGNAPVVRLLLCSRAAVDVADSDGCTALHFAVHNACGEPGYHQVLGELLAARADTRCCAADGTSARSLAESFTGALDLLRLLGGDG